MEDQFVGPLALAGSERARNGRRNAIPHAAVGRLQNQHDPGKCQRGTRERVGSDAAKEKSVERDHARKREQVEDIRCCQP